MTVMPVDHYTITDLDDLDLPQGRHEIIEGSVHVTPPPSPAQEVVILRLERQLRAHLPDTVVLAHNLGVGWPSHYLVPDIAIVGWAALEADRLVDPAAVLAVVEVVSPSTRTHDRVTKAQLYPAIGVPRYWLVDPGAHEVVVLGAGRPMTVRSGIVELVVAPDLAVSIDVDAIFARPADPAQG